jgi:hypothetical protein
MPKGTDVQVGFLAPQSKQIWKDVSRGFTACGHARVGPEATYLVGLLGLQFLEQLLRLLLGRECAHVGRPCVSICLRGRRWGMGLRLMQM